MTRRLSDVQNQEVLRLADLARWVAHRVWQSSHLPARHLEELQADAVVMLCDIVLLWRDRDHWTLKDVVCFRLWRQLRRKAHHYKRQRVIPPEDITLVAPSMDDSKTDTLNQSLRSLPRPQREVIERRYGLDGGGTRSQMEVARELSTTQSNVCRAESRAIRNLQEWLEEYGCHD